MNYLPELARFANSYLNLLYGCLIVLLMIFMPMGLAGILKEAVVRYRVQRNKQLPGDGGKGGPSDVVS